MRVVQSTNEACLASTDYIVEWVGLVGQGCLWESMLVGEKRGGRGGTEWSRERVGWCVTSDYSAVRTFSNEPPAAAAVPNGFCAAASSPFSVFFASRAASAPCPGKCGVPDGGWDSSMSWGEQLEERGGGWG